jgi:hypothetical protein
MMFAAVGGLGSVFARFAASQKGFFMKRTYNTLIVSKGGVFSDGLLVLTNHLIVFIFDVRYHFTVAETAVFLEPRNHLFFREISFPFKPNR